MLVPINPLQVVTKLLLVLMMGGDDMPPYKMVWSREPMLAPDSFLDHDYSLVQLTNGYYQLQFFGLDESVYFSPQQLIEIMGFLNSDEYAQVVYGDNKLEALAGYIVSKNLLYIGTNQLPTGSIGTNSSTSSNIKSDFSFFLSVGVRQPDTRMKKSDIKVFSTSMHEIVACRKNGNITKLQYIKHNLEQSYSTWWYSTEATQKVEKLLVETEKSLIDLGYLSTDELRKDRLLLKNGNVKGLEARLAKITDILNGEGLRAYCRCQLNGGEVKLKVEQYYLTKMLTVPILNDQPITNYIRIIATGGTLEAKFCLEELNRVWARLNPHERKLIEQQLGFNPIKIADAIIAQRPDKANIIPLYNPENMTDLVHAPVEQLVIHILENSFNMQLVGTKLNMLADQVFDQWSKTEWYNPEIESDVCDSINRISATASPHEFIVHVTMVEQILSEIDTKVHNRPSWAQRSPQLLGRALCKFFMGLNPITQTIDSVMTLVHLGQWMATITVGDWYLSTEEYEKRMEGYAKTWDALSLENLQKLTAEQWIDIGAQIAANCFYGAGGLSRTLRYLKEIDAIAKTQRQAAQIARKMIKTLDEAIDRNPLVVTAEGLVMRMNDGIEKVGNSVKNVTKNTEQFIQNSKQISQEIIKRTPEILEYMQSSFNNLVHTSNKIKKIKDNVFNVSHTFAPDHISKGILKVGQSAKEISAQFVDIIKKVDALNLLKDGPNTIRTYINNIPVEIRVFIKEDTLISLNAFVIHSKRQVTNLIEI